MIPWIQVYSNLPTHPKISKLADALGLSSSAVNPNMVAVGIMVGIWTWAVQNAYSGDLSEVTDRAIADAATWKKKPETLVKALISCGWMDADRKLHDWEEYALLLLKSEEDRRAKTRERVQRFRNRKSEDSNDDCNADSNGYCNVTETPCNASTIPYQTIHNSTVPKEDSSFYLSSLERKKETKKESGECGSEGRFESYYSGLTGQERVQKAMEYATFAKAMHDSGNEAGAQNFADIAQYGGFQINRETYRFDG